MKTKVAAMRKGSWLLLITLALWWLAAAVEALAAPSYDYLISIDAASHRKFGLYYPATYKFRLQPGASRLSTQVRYGQGSWQTLPEKGSGEIFNGVDAVRFDYAGGFAYVSASFNKAYDSFYIRFLNSAGQPVPADFVSIPKYYDDRAAAVSIVLDDWNIAFDGLFDKAVGYLQGDQLYFSVAVIAGDVNFGSLQQHIDRVGDLMEIASHSQHHPCTAEAYAVSGYGAETAGSRDELAANLSFDHKPYVPLYVEPCGYSDPGLESAVTAANYLVERCSNNFFYSGAEFVAWDPALGRYGRAAETFDDGPAGDTPALLTEANAAFDKVLGLGGIYTLVDHPNPKKDYWYDNSYFLQHLDYIKGRSDIWYVPFGQMYQYHFLQEMRGNLRVQSLGNLPAQVKFAATPVTGTVPLTVTFTDSSTGSIAAWSWDFGDATTASSRNPVHLYSRAGSYSAKLTVTSSDGSGTSTAAKAITVTPRADTTVRITSPWTGSRFTAPATFTLAATASAGTGATIRQVDFYAGNSLVGTSATSPYCFIWRAVTPGTYSLTAKVTDSLGAVATSSAVTVTVVPPLPSPWATKDVGAVGETGSATLANDTFTLSGSGSGISGTADAFRYVYKAMTGNGEMVARVASLGNTDPLAKGGIMFRQSLAADSMHAMMNLTAQRGAEFLARSHTGGAASSTLDSGITAPYWIRLVRSGNLFTGYISADGTTWTEVASSTIAMSGTVYAGFAVTSHNNAVLCSADFENKVVVQDKTAPVVTSFTLPHFSRSLTVPITGFTATDDVGVTGYLITESPVKPSLAAPGWIITAAAPLAAGSGTTAPGLHVQMLPGPWTGGDIGAVGTAGSASYRNGVFTIAAGGSANSAGEDALHYLYKEMSGDGQMFARVVGLKGDCGEGEAGVMMRQNVAAGSITAAMMLGSDAAAFSRRGTDNGSTTVTSRAGAAPPYWVGLVRSGDTISSYVSSDGANWELLESDQVTMTDPVLIGLAAGSGGSSARCTATFDNVQ
jgi:PKD repeat protein